MNNVVHFLPALGGDCTLLEFDNKECILIDCGYKSTYEKELRPLLVELNNRGYKIKLLIISHIDSDHIQGAISFLKDNGESKNPQIITIENIWFNGFYSTLFINDVFKKHKLEVMSQTQEKTMRIAQGQIEMQLASEGGMISAMQSKSFEVLCSELGYCVNYQFDKQVVKRNSNKDIKLPNDKIKLGEFDIRVLSPNDELINKLAIELNIELIKIFGKDYHINSDAEFLNFYEKLMLLKKEEPISSNVLISGKSDDIESWLGTSTLASMNDVNQASIVVQIEYKGIKMLFTGDSDSELWQDSIEPYYDLIKISHHGTLKPNLCLIKKTIGKHILISTNGKKYGHPEKDLVANLILYNKGELHFNYDINIKDIILKNQDKYKYKASFRDRTIHL